MKYELTLTEQRLIAFIDHVWLGIGAQFKMVLTPCADTTIIEKGAVNNCTISYLDKDYTFGGISEQTYNYLYNYYFVLNGEDVGYLNNNLG